MCTRATQDTVPTLISVALCARPRARSMNSLLVMTDLGRRMYWKIQSMGAANMPQPANTRNRIQPARAEGHTGGGTGQERGA
jgi:hypothetical protein